MHAKALIALFVAAMAPIAAAAADGPVGFVQRELAPSLIEPRDYELISNEDSIAVVSLTAIAPEVKYFDDRLPAQRMNLYVYLVKEGNGWAISGSANAMPKTMRMNVKYGLSQSAAEMASSSSMTLERAEWIHAHMLLAASTDDVLIANFHDKRKSFEEIRNRVRFDDANQYPTIDHGWPRYKEFLDDTLIDYIDLKNQTTGNSKGSCSVKDCFALIVMLDAPHYEIGYLHVTRPADVPPISQDGYIVVRSLGDGWYFFRRG